MDKDIQILIRRFMAGQTSIEEEDRLAEYFRTHDVDGEWREYKEMFAWFDKGMPDETLPASMADGNGANEATQQPTLSPRNRQRNKPRHKASRRLPLLIAAAAAMALLLIMAWPSHEQPLTADTTAKPSTPEGKTHVTTADTLTADTAMIEVPKKKKPARKLRRDLYKPMPPKTYLAKAAQDSISEAAEMIAEEKIRETEMQQEEIINNIFEEYKRIETNVEIYVTALENYEIEEEYY